MKNFKNNFLLGATLLTGAFAGQKAQAQQNKAAYNIATYYNLHYQADKHIGVGLFAGPVFNLQGGPVSVETNFYAGCRVTGDKSPIKVGLGATAGFAFSKNGKAMYANPNIRLAPNIQNPKLSFLNNAYVISALPVTKDLNHLKEPNLMLGFVIPFGKNKGKTSQSVWVESQRYPQ